MAHTYYADMARRERDILEDADAVRRIAEQAANTNKVIDEAMEAELTAGHPRTIAAKQVRLELLKADLSGTREAGPQLHRVWHGGSLGPGHQHVRPWALGASLPSTA